VNLEIRMSYKMNRRGSYKGKDIQTTRSFRRRI